MLKPKNTKFLKFRKRIPKGINSKSSIKFGMFAIKSLENNKINYKQIESARRVITKNLKKEGKVWIRIFPDIPVTKKPLEIRMGKGKGNLDSWVSIVKVGTILYEFNIQNENLARSICKTVSSKLPIKIKFEKKKKYD